MSDKENYISKKKRVRSTTTQITMLSDYMAAHPHLANNEFNGPQGKAQRDRQWESLRTILNEHGPEKTADQWEHTWRDLRRNARNIGARVKSAQRATGNISNVPDLSPQVLKILGTIGPESAFGIAGAEETGDVSKQLMNINNQLATSQKYNAIRMRLAFRERMWRLRQNRFTF